MTTDRSSSTGCRASNGTVNRAPLHSLIGESRVLNLGQPLSAAAPHHPNYPPFSLVLQHRYGDQVTPGGMTFASSLIVMTDHHGTHVDAIGHVTREPAPSSCS